MDGAETVTVLVEKGVVAVILKEEAVEAAVRAEADVWEEEAVEAAIRAEAGAQEEEAVEVAVQAEAGAQEEAAEEEGNGSSKINFLRPIWRPGAEI